MEWTCFSTSYPTSPSVQLSSTLQRLWIDYGSDVVTESSDFDGPTKHRPKTVPQWPRLPLTESFGSTRLVSAVDGKRKKRIRLMRKERDKGGRRNWKKKNEWKRKGGVVENGNNNRLLRSARLLLPRKLPLLWTHIPSKREVVRSCCNTTITTTSPPVVVFNLVLRLPSSVRLRWAERMAFSSFVGLPPHIYAHLHIYESTFHQEQGQNSIYLLCTLNLFC